MGQLKDAPDVRNTKKFKEVQAKIQTLTERIKDLEAQRTEIYRSQKVVCPTCHTRSKILDLVLVSHYRYHKSYSSYEDSSWDFTGDISTPCPHCHELYLYNNDWLKEFESYFAIYRGSFWQSTIGLRYYHGSDPHHLNGLYEVVGCLSDTKEYPITSEKIYKNLATWREREKQLLEQQKIPRITTSQPITRKA